MKNWQVPKREEIERRNWNGARCGAEWGGRIGEYVGDGNGYQTGSCGCFVGGGYDGEEAERPAEREQESGESERRYGGDGRGRCRMTIK
jgi:uncharacterized protein YcfJ